MKHLAAQGNIGSKIYFIRGKKVMLDSDLAVLYGVTTKRFNEQVKRNRKRFPSDFMWCLSWAEVENLLSSRSQFATLNRGHNIKYRPYVFTEQGIAMLSGILNSGRAIQVNIAIMRAFVKLKEVLSVHKELAEKLGLLERKVGKHDQKIKAIIQTIQQMIEAPLPVEEPPKRRVGFHRG